MCSCRCKTAVDNHLTSVPGTSAPAAHCNRTGRDAVTTTRALGPTVLRENAPTVRASIRVVNEHKTLSSKTWARGVYERAGVGARLPRGNCDV
eukprot:8791283-Lingulodinium_polyedra.AAC.1